MIYDFLYDFFMDSILLPKRVLLILPPTHSHSHSPFQHNSAPAVMAPQIPTSPTRIAQVKNQPPSKLEASFLPQ